MKTFLSILVALLLIGASPALASERGGGGGHGGGCGGGCGGGGHPGRGYHGGGHSGGNVNVNVNANAYASAYAGAGAGSYINARAYNVGSIGNQGGGYGGVVSMGGGGPVGDYGYGVGGYGPVVVTGPGYGPSRPFGYVAQGFGRRYVTTDRCCGRRPAPAPDCRSACGGGYPPPPPPPPPPPSCNCRDGYGSGYDGGYGDGYAYQESRSGRSGSSYAVRETYSESAYQGGYHGGTQYVERRDEGPRYAPIPYQAAPLEPVPYGQDYAPPQIQYSQPAYAPPTYAPVEPQVYQPAPVYIQPPQGYYGDLPPGDTGQGMPYRQEPGERG